MAGATATLGAQFRQARELRGLSLADVAAMTKISTRALAAIERDAFDRLPGGIFRRAYVRSFAEAVGLDADACAQAYLSRWEPASPEFVDVDRRSGRRPRAAWLAFGALAAILTAILVVGARTTPVTPALEEAGARFEVRPALTRSGARAPSPPETPPPDAGVVRVRLEATDRCELSASENGRVIVPERMFEAGETVAFEIASPVTLRIGDAGAVTFTLNGRRGRSLGANGEAVTVEITPENYETLLAAGEVAL